MPQKILKAQDVKELKFLYGKNIKNFKCLPLDLKTQLYCVDKGIDYFNLLKFSNNEFHSKVQFDTNSVVLTDEKGEPIGTRIFGPVTRELRTKGHTKIISLAPEVL